MKMETIQTDLFFQIWLAEVDALADISAYPIEFLYKRYSEGLSAKDFYFYCIYLPF